MNIEEIAHAMVNMSINEENRKRMGEAGYKRVNAFYRIDQMKDVYREIYKGFSDSQNLSWTAFKTIQQSAKDKEDICRRADARQRYLTQNFTL